MGEFSAGWLRLREPVDRRSRNATVAAALRDHFAGRPRVGVVDIGCGTGANLRATAALLGTRQDWCLIDHDPALLDCARDTLASWADTAERDADALVLTHAGRTITVRFRQVDLARDVDGALGDAPDLVTASAFFDLVSARFIDALVQATVRRHAVFHTVLTVSGMHQWSPETEWDGPTSRAFNAHQESDKGFGSAAGPHASALLATGFEAAGYRVATGDSPWTLGPADDALLQELNIGIAGAVAETGPGGLTLSAQWSTVRRTGAVVGHTDLVAIPPQ